MRTFYSFIKRRLAIRGMDCNAAQSKGEPLVNSGKAAESVPYFRQAIRANPGEPATAASLNRAREKLAEALRKTGRSRQADKLLKEITPAPEAR